MKIFKLFLFHRKSTKKQNVERGSSLFSFQLKTLTQINASFHHYIDLTFRISDKLGFNRKRIPVHIMLYFLLRFGALPIHNSYDLRTLENLNLLVQRTIFIECFHKHVLSFQVI